MGGDFAVPLFWKNSVLLTSFSAAFLFMASFPLEPSSFTSLRESNPIFLKYWKEAALSAIIIDLLHFAALTLGIRFTNASLITLIMGTSPITIIVFSAWMKKETNLLKMFIWPSAHFCRTRHHEFGSDAK